MARRLSDEDVQRFLRDGFLVLNCQNDYDPTLHERIAAASSELFKDGDKDKNPGDRVNEVIPEMSQVWASATVDGALRSLLGDDYIMHAHRHLHERLPGQVSFQLPGRIANSHACECTDHMGIACRFVIFGRTQTTKSSMSMAPLASHLLSVASWSRGS